MDQPLYRFIEWIAARAHLLWLVQCAQTQLLFGLLMFAVLCCLFGFYCYRAVFAGLTLLSVIAASYVWILPVWGAQACVTASAVLGVALAFLAFRWYRLGAVMLCALIGGSLVLYLAGLSAPSILAALAVAAAAGTAAFFFPLLGISGLTALWGAQVLAQEGWRHFQALGGAGAMIGVPVTTALLTAAGLALQLTLFRNQRLFSRALPKWLTARLQGRQEKKGVTA